MAGRSSVDSEAMAQRVANESHRLFLCARCGAQVRLCSSCDRGQVYCGRVCAVSARRAGHREANQRYQRTERGRALHAQRQARYRAQRRQQAVVEATSVTDLGRTESASRAAAASWDAEVYTCACCGRQVSPFSRWLPISKSRQRLRRGRRRRRPPLAKVAASRANSQKTAPLGSR